MLGLDIVSREVRGEYLVYSAVPSNAVKRCPLCGSGRIVKYKKQTRTVRDLNEDGHKVTVIISGHRYQCRDCGGNFGEEYAAADKSGRLTKRLKAAIQRECLESTFKAAAERYGISQTSVKRVFAEYIKEMNAVRTLAAPEILGIDEVMLHNQYRGVFVDVTNGRVLEITENRSKEAVRGFLLSLPDREKITCVAMDMRRIYKSAVEELLPNAAVVIGKRYVIAELNKAFDDLRPIVRAAADKLRDMRSLLTADSAGLSQSQTERLESILGEYPRLKTMYELKEELCGIFTRCKTRGEAETRYEKWLKSCRENSVSAFESFIETAALWHTEIFNRFDYPRADSADSFGDIIREINRAGRGYDFEVIRARVLFRGA